MCQQINEVAAAAMEKAPNNCNCHCTCNSNGNGQQNSPSGAKNRNLTYSFKKVLKNFFKKSSKSNSSSSSLSTSFETVHHLPFSSYPFNDLESLENDRNTQLQCEQQPSFYMETDDNMANEKLVAINSIDKDVCSPYDNEEDDEAQVYVPVRYARTEAGTYFWTTNLHQPIISNVYQRPQDPLDDDSNVSYCLPYQDYACPEMGFGQDRWAQA